MKYHREFNGNDGLGPQLIMSKLTHNVQTACMESRKTSNYIRECRNFNIKFQHQGHMLEMQMEEKLLLLSNAQ